MFLKELLLRLNRTLWGQFLREICLFKKMTPKVGRNRKAVKELNKLSFGQMQTRTQGCITEPVQCYHCFMGWSYI
jgi:hypothetical protein